MHNNVTTQEFYTATHPNTTISTTKSAYKRNQKEKHAKTTHTHISSGTRNSKNQNKITQRKTNSAVIRKTILFNNTINNNK
jgi:hypothetical protein